MWMAIRRLIVVAFGLAFQISLTYLAYKFLGDHIGAINVVYNILGILIIFGLIRKSKGYAYTLPWIIIILLFPLPGTLLYIIIGRNKRNSKVLRKIVKSEKENKKYLIQDKKIREDFKDNGKLKYLSDFNGYPVTKNNDISYYPTGELAFEAMIEDLKKAEKFIFLEYFVICEGHMWNSILSVLEEKAAQGIDVRLIYDDLGCVSTLDSKYHKKLEKKGIKCIVFNELNPIAGVIMNNRDHRKILVIDGKIAYSGGINLADEYINKITRFGHWKDNGIKISGDGVWNYTVLFLTMWNAFRPDDNNFEKYKYSFKNKNNNLGYACPYGETPLDDETTGENLYLNIINQAIKYVYIFTPYLIIDVDMENALSLAAKRGVDVKIIIPAIPDKKTVYMLSEAYMETLINNGVKVYKYTPGFLHSKVFVSDDKIATIGTINMDYRSLYLNFECGLYLEDAKVIDDIKKDFTSTLKKSHEVSKEEAKPKILKGIIQVLLKIFAPIM